MPHVEHILVPNYGTSRGVGGANGAHAQVEILIREGPVTEDILKVAEHRSADLIVMATHGRSGVRRPLLGSVTEKVIRVSPCPVLAVRSD